MNAFINIAWGTHYWLLTHDDIIKWKHFPRYWPFARRIEYGSWPPCVSNFITWTTSFKGYGVSNHRQFDCTFKILFRLITRNITDPLWLEIYWWLSSQRVSNVQWAFPCRDVIIFWTRIGWEFNCILIGGHVETWWRHQMETFSVLLALCAVTGEFLSQRPVTRSFNVFFDLCLNKRLSKQSRRWWFETPLRSLWRHDNATVVN